MKLDRAGEAVPGVGDGEGLGAGLLARGVDVVDGELGQEEGEVGGGEEGLEGVVVLDSYRTNEQI